MDSAQNAPPSAPLDSDNPGTPRHRPHTTLPLHQPVTAPHAYPAHSARHTLSRQTSTLSSTDPPLTHPAVPRTTSTAMQSSLRNSPHPDPVLLPTIQRAYPLPQAEYPTHPTHTSHRPDSRH